MCFINKEIWVGKFVYLIFFVVKGKIINMMIVIIDDCMKMILDLDMSFFMGCLGIGKISILR